MPERTPVNVFLCYAPQDEELRGELETHLALLKRQGYVRSWSARRIGAGEEWRGAIDRHLEEAEVILLLVSADFLASDYLYDVELRRALERHRTERTKVISILLRPYDYAFKDSPLAEIEVVLPRNGVAVTSWPSHDAAFAEIAQELRLLLQQEGRAASGGIASNPRAAHLPRASGGWARARRCATLLRTPRSPRRGTCPTGAAPRSRGATKSSPISTPA
jgi:TIR domain